MMDDELNPEEEPVPEGILGEEDLPADTEEEDELDGFTVTDGDGVEEEETL